MGHVYLGLSAGGRPVAVKVIRADLAADPEFRVRFAREVAAVRQVSGLFTALVLDADVESALPWLATAYVAGPSLAEAVTGDGPMAAQPALALAAGLAESLSAIHAAGVVHCDLKPSNVLLSPDGPRVIDFGISRAAGPVPAAGVGCVTGSPGFMSPEQALGRERGPPSDRLRLGAVLAVADAGRGPAEPPGRPAGRRRWRPLTAAGVTSGVLAASVAVSFALGAAGPRSSAARLAPRAAAAPTLTTAPPAVPGTRPAATRPSSRGHGPRAAIIPAAVAVGSPRPSRPSPSTTSAPTSPPASPLPASSSPGSP